MLELKNQRLPDPLTAGRANSVFRS